MEKVANISSEDADKLTDVAVSAGFVSEQRWQTFPLVKTMPHGKITIDLDGYSDRRSGFKKSSASYSIYINVESCSQNAFKIPTRFDLVKPSKTVEPVMDVAALEAKAAKIDAMFQEFIDKLGELNKTCCASL